MRVFLLICLIFPLLQTATCARILGVFFFPGYSHFIQGETLFKELAARGHEVTMVSVFPQKEKLKNYRDVPITALNDIIANMRNSEEFKSILTQSKAAMLLFISMFGKQMTDMTLQDENFQNLLHSNETYDVIIIEHFFNEMLFGLMHHFNAPLIAMSPSSSSFLTNRLYGNPASYASISNFFLNVPPNMNIWQRAWNSIFSFGAHVFSYTWALPEQEKVMHKHFPDAPPLEDLMQNVSLIFLNSHPTFGTPVPLLPNMIEIGGFHVEAQKQKVLPPDLKKFLDEAKEGVVYFSMGSNLKSKDLDKDKLQHILKTFSKLKMKVLWKWEEDNLPGKPDNVKTEKWLPQPSVLAHKNVKVFMTHGGKLSTIESIYHGKPVLGIPMFAEQHTNIQEAAYYGYGLYISYDALTEDLLTEALTEIIENPKYAEQAKYRSSALRDLQVSPLDNAVQWVEYVAKHKGVPHLKNTAINLPLYQYLLLDVILVTLIVIWLLKKVIYFLLRQIFSNSKTQKQKIS